MEIIYKEKEFKKKINVDKAIKKSNIAVVAIIISILTYIVPLINGIFDFGIIFESVSLIFLIIAKQQMDKYDENSARRYINYSLMAIGWILIYDLILIISCLENVYEIFFIIGDYLYLEHISLIYILILFIIKKDLLKANDPIQYKESTDWFYEKYEEKR